MKRGDLFTKLHDQYNTYSSPIQDPDAFHHDSSKLIGDPDWVCDDKYGSPSGAMFALAAIIFAAKSNASWDSRDIVGSVP